MDCGVDAPQCVRIKNTIYQIARPNLQVKAAAKQIGADLLKGMAIRCEQKSKNVQRLAAVSNSESWGEKIRKVTQNL
jgi:hypothetical protein